MRVPTAIGSPRSQANIWSRGAKAGFRRNDEEAVAAGIGGMTKSEICQ